MPASIHLHNLTWATPDGRPLINALTLSIGPGRTGLVGRNGAGKTTLMRLITGDLPPAAGQCRVTGRLAVLRQQTGADLSGTVADALGIATALACLARIEAGTPIADDLDTADWTLPTRAGDALARLGLPGLTFDRPMNSLSGGMRTRVHLAALLIATPDCLLLDEPTNNLDTDGRTLIMRFLADWPGLALVASHDRPLLRAMDRIVELSGLGAKLYGGNYDLYRERKAEELTAAQHDLTVAQQTAAQVDRDIQLAHERKQRSDSQGKKARAKGTDPKMALDAAKQRSENSSGKASDLADRKRAAAAEAVMEARKAIENLTPLHIAVPSTGLPKSKHILSLRSVGWVTPDAQPILHDLSFDLVGPERLAITGANGAGKSTLLHLIANTQSPSTGQVERHVPYALLDQSVTMLNPDQTLLESLRQRQPALNDNQTYALLARFAFRNSDALKPVRILSGGERLRAGLACVLGQPEPPALLLLDEPTNHLDLESIEILEAALLSYDGALIAVSHDTDFLEVIGVTRTISLTP